MNLSVQNSSFASVPSSVERWLYSTDHKDIGTMYIIFGALSGILGTVVFIYIRTELSHPIVQILAENNQSYNPLVTAHAFLMIFFMVMPILIGGFGNWLDPILGGTFTDLSLRLLALPFFIVEPFRLKLESVLAKTLFNAAVKGLKPVLQNPKTWTVIGSGVGLCAFMRSLPANSEISISPKKGFHISKGPSSGANAAPILNEASNLSGDSDLFLGLPLYDLIMFVVYPLLLMLTTVTLITIANSRVGQRLLRVSYSGIQSSIPVMLLTYLLGGVFGPYYCAILSIVPAGVMVDRLAGDAVKVPDSLFYRVNIALAFGMCLSAWICLAILYLTTDFTFSAWLVSTK